MKTLRIIFLEIPILILLLVDNTTHAQITFERTYGSPDYELCHSVIPTMDGGYLMEGHTERFNPGEIDIYMIKVDGNGDTLWTRNYGGYKDHWSFANIIQRDNGDFALISCIRGFIDTVYYDNYFLLFDSTGNIITTKSYGGSNNENATGFVNTYDSGYAVGGYTRSIGAGKDEYFILKLDGQGDTTWLKTYGGPEDDQALGIKEMPDGGFVLVGRTLNFGTGYIRGYIIRTNEFGDTLWTKVYTDTSNQFSNVELTPDGGFIVSGSTNQNFGEWDILVMRLDSMGEIIWKKTFDHLDNEVIFSSYATSDGKYLFAGETVDLQMYTHLILFSLDIDGNILWANIHGESAQVMGGSYIADAHDGGYVISGYNSAKGAGSQDMFLIKTDSIGNTTCSTPISLIPQQISLTAAATTTIVGSGDQGDFLVGIPTPVRKNFTTTLDSICVFIPQPPACIDFDTLIKTKICFGDTFNGYSSAGIYYDTFTTNLGCDSIITLQLELDSILEKEVFITIEEGDSIFAGGSFQTTPGVYYDTITGSATCDSLIITQLSVSTGIDENLENEITIYPNPVSQNLHITINSLKVNSIEVLDVFGKSIRKTEEQVDQYTIEMNDLPSGLYFIRLNTDRGSYTKKIVKH